MKGTSYGLVPFFIYPIGKGESGTAYRAESIIFTMIMRLLPIICIYLLIPIGLWGQSQNTQRYHWWCFGDGWTLNFANTPPTHNQNAAIDQFEGCATLSDGAGRLLFYTDGMTVWQRNNTVMPNGQGLLGDDGSTMSAIITPVIGNRNQYYIFTVDGTTTLPNNGPNGRFDGLHYSIVDMTLNGGFGQVIQKNIPLVDSTTEKIIALKGANEREYWVVTQLYNKSRYHAYKIDCSGISTTPVISNAGLPVSGTVSYGYMTPNRRGDQIASIVTDTSFFGLPERVELLDFDPLTGLLSNPRAVTGTGAAYYGLAYAPNDSALYVGDISNQRIISFDPFAANIPASQQVVHNYGLLGADIGALQLGPDDKIYIKKFNTLDVINQPNNRANPNFQTGAVNLINGSIFNATLGLPAWFDIWPAPITAPDTTICKGNSTPIGVPSIPGFTYSWSPAGSLSNPATANPIATPLTTTTYTLFATFAGCTDTAYVTVNVLGDTAFIKSSLGHYNWCPNRQQVLTGIGIIPIRWLKDGQPIPGSTGTTTLVTGPGQYQLAGTDSCGNPDTLATVITVVPPTASIAPGDSLFICSDDIQPLFAQGGTVLQWLRNGQPLTGTSPVRAATLPGLYQVVIEDTCGLTDTASTLLQYYPGPTIQFSVPDTTLLCPGGSFTLSATGGQPVNWQRNNQIIPGATDTFLVVQQTGTYQLIMEDALGCRDTGKIVVLSYATLDSLITQPDTALCQGDTLAITTIGGGAFNWQPSTGLSCLNCPSPMAYPTTNTTYTVTLTDPLGCSITDSISLSVLALPTVDAGTPLAFCPGDTVALQATGATSYQWQPSSDLSCLNCPAPLAHPDTTTFFFVTGTNNQGCQAIDSVQITALPKPTVTLSGADTICTGDTLTLTAAGAATYTWTGAQLSCVTCPQPMVTPTSSGLYRVIGTALNGCRDTALSTVVVLQSGSLQLPNDTTICPGDTLSLSPVIGSAPQSVQWQPANGLSCTSCLSPTASPATSTTYTLNVLTAQGCAITDSVTVNVSILGALAVTTDTTICIGNSGLLTASGGTQYQWTPATALSCASCPITTVTATADIQYTVTALDTNGCTLRDSVQVTVTPGPTLQVFGNNFVCIGDTLALQVQGAATYQWQPAGSLTCTACPNPGAFPNQTTTYTVQGADNSGCSSVDSIIITVQTRDTVTLQGDTLICRGDTALWIVSGLNNYFWQSTGTVNCLTCDTLTLMPQSTTTYNVSGIGASGCPTDTTFTLTVGNKPNVTVNLSAAAVCQGEAIQMTATGADTYVWSPGTYLDCVTCDTAIAIPQQSINYTLTGTTIAGCTNSVPINLQVWDNPVVQLPTDTTVCRYAKLTLSADPFTQIDWRSDLPIDCNACPDPTISAVRPGVVSIAVSDSNGCQAEDSMRIQLHPDVSLTISPDTQICAGDTLLLSVTPGQQFSWTPVSDVLQPQSAQTSAIPSASKAFTVVVTDASGCRDTAITNVTILPKPTADAGPDLTLFVGESGQLSGLGNGDPIWQPILFLDQATVFNPTVSLPADSQQYILTVTDDFGCRNNDSVWVRVLVPEIIVVPNAFSPNNDGRNDFFNIPALQYYTLSVLTVYNRWGQLVYRTSDNQTGWDGTINGIPQPPGVYTYRAILRTPTGGQLEKQGNITLFR